MTAEMVPAKANEEPSTMHMLSIFWGLGGELVDENGSAGILRGKERRVPRGGVPDVSRHGGAPARWCRMSTTMDEAALRPFFYGGEVSPIGGSSSRRQADVERAARSGRRIWRSPPIRCPTASSR